MAIAVVASAVESTNAAADHVGGSGDAATESTVGITNVAAGSAGGNMHAAFLHDGTWHAGSSPRASPVDA